MPLKKMGYVGLPVLKGRMRSDTQLSGGASNRYQQEKAH